MSEDLESHRLAWLMTPEIRHELKAFEQERELPITVCAASSGDL
jgi:hypothetical protein